jgi:tubulin--tyrosine ligase-like protein 12
MAALLCVDLDQRIGTEESDEHDGKKNESSEHVLHVFSSVMDG